MNDPSDVPGFDEANEAYENRHPEDGGTTYRDEDEGDEPEEDEDEEEEEEEHDEDEELALNDAFDDGFLDNPEDVNEDD